MTRLSLDGEWQLWGPDRRLEHPDELAGVELEPVAARVPGNVELDLARAGVIPEPFYADNIRRLRPLEFKDWWYTRPFVVPTDAAGQSWELIFAGLDTLATVWVNGIEVGRADNGLIEHRFDVTAALKPGEVNHVAVRLCSALQHARRFHYDAGSMSWERREEGLFIRKAPHVWGWDIMPRAVSAGIWRSTWLETRPATAIEQLYYWTVGVSPEGAMLGVRFQFRTDARVLDGFAMRFHGQCEDHAFQFEWPVEFIAGGCMIPVPGARLWWPKGYSDSREEAPHLYRVTAQLCHEGRVLAERTERIGLRKLVVDRTETAGMSWAAQPAGRDRARIDQPPDPDSHFCFYVNDVPIMVKGANWVPLDAFHSRDAERVERAVALFDDLGCNMIRCWGGNVYEDHRFFDLCDERGIMVWQDFAFACCRYPQDETFLAQVRQEAQSVVEKLRNHPSLALWCGDNEIDAAYVSQGLSPEQNRLTREVIPQVLHRCDPYRASVPSSPYVPPSVPPTGEAWMRTPEQHLWGPRGYFKSPFYTQHSAHFIGEIGYHGCPNAASIRRFISPEKVWPWQDNDEWQVHSVYHWQHDAIDRDRIQLMANQVHEMFGAIPETLPEFALVSQIIQAEAKKFFIESTRLRKWRTSGILWWNVLDGWPQFSDAIVDYYWGKKLAYHYIRRVQQPVCAIIGEPGSAKYLPLVVCNDSRDTAEVSYRVWDAESGETAVEGTVIVPANQNWQVGRIRTYASDQRLYLIEWQVEGRSFGNHYLSGSPPFDLAQYRAWLGVIAALERSFDPELVAR